MIYRGKTVCVFPSRERNSPMYVVLIVAKIMYAFYINAMSSFSKYGRGFCPGEMGVEEDGTVTMNSQNWLPNDTNTLKIKVKAELIQPGILYAVV